MYDFKTLLSMHGRRVTVEIKGGARYTGTLYHTPHIHPEAFEVDVFTADGNIRAVDFLAGAVVDIVAMAEAA